MLTYAFRFQPLRHLGKVLQINQSCRHGKGEQLPTKTEPDVSSYSRKSPMDAVLLMLLATPILTLVILGQLVLGQAFAGHIELVT